MTDFLEVIQVSENHYRDLVDFGEEVLPQINSFGELPKRLHPGIDYEGFVVPLLREKGLDMVPQSIETQYCNFLVGNFPSARPGLGAFTTEEDAKIRAGVADGQTFPEIAAMPRKGLNGTRSTAAVKRR